MTTRVKVSLSTRDSLLRKARHLFSERGFYGASLADIATAQGVSKQGLLHHFPTKARLYGDVLSEIAAELEGQIERARENVVSPEQRLIGFFQGMSPTNAEQSESLRLILRELLDVQRRAKTASQWPLSNFLTQVEDMLREVPGWDDVSQAEVGSLFYQWFGAVLYAEAARITHQGIFGEELEQSSWAVASDRLGASMKTILKTGPQLPR